MQTAEHIAAPKACGALAMLQTAAAVLSRLCGATGAIGGTSADDTDGDGVQLIESGRLVDAAGVRAATKGGDVGAGSGAASTVAVRVIDDGDG